MDRQERRLALIEVLERDGRVRQAVPVWRWPVAIGRAFDNDVVLDDAFVAPRHARLDVDAQGEVQLQVEDGVRNGVQIGHRTIAAGAAAGLPRAPFGIGASLLRVRWAGEPLAPERALARRRSAAGVALTGLLLWGLVVAEVAVAQDPGARLSSWLVPVLGAPVAIAAWAASWGLMSKLFRHQFEFWPHLAIAVSWGLATSVLRLALPLVAFALAWSWLLVPALLVPTALFFGMVRAHALRVLPERRGGITLAVLAGFIALVGVQAINQHQSTDRWFGPLYLWQLGPPWLRVAPTVPVAQFIDGAAGLQAGLAKNAAADQAEESDGDEP